jgi:CRP-like cAMP-binding protein
VETTQRTVLYEAGATIRHVYFPRTGLISLVGLTAEGQGTEVGMIGAEGFCGIPVMFGGTSQQFQATVQITGTVEKMPIHLLDERSGKTPLSDVLRRYALIQLNQITQSAICNRFHTLTQRLCRWLLTAADRTETDALELTQEYLSQMIGARRPALAYVVGRLQRKGLIRGERNCIRVVHRQGLEALACECYGAVRNDIEAFLTSIAVPHRTKPS